MERGTAMSFRAADKETEMSIKAVEKSTVMSAKGAVTPNANVSNKERGTGTSMNVTGQNNMD